MPDTIDNISLVIANGASASGALRLYEFHQLSFWIPQDWTAAALSLQVARQEAEPTLSSQWWTVADVNGEVSLPASAGRVLVMNAGLMLPAYRWLRVVSGSVAAPVSQGAERTIPVTGRRF